MWWSLFLLSCKTYHLPIGYKCAFANSTLTLLVYQTCRVKPFLLYLVRLFDRTLVIKSEYYFGMNCEPDNSYHYNN